MLTNLFLAKGRTIRVYVLCGFANLGSLAILLGRPATVIRERKAQILAPSFKTLLAGCLVPFLTASAIGVII